MINSPNPVPHREPNLRTRSGLEGGFTLVEIMIALTGLSAILLTVFSVVSTTSSISNSTKEFSILNRKVHGASERVLAQLYQAQASSLEIDATGSSLSFQEVTNYVDGELVLSAPVVIEMVSDPQDPFDGIDNDEDGLIDEADIVLRRDFGLPSQQTTVLAQDLQWYLDGELPNGLDDNGNDLIDERGLNFQFENGLLTIRIGMNLVQSNENVLSRSSEFSFTLRN